MKDAAEMKPHWKLSSQAREDQHRVWIAGRVATLLAHYWREDEPEELLRAISADWADVLHGFTREAIQKACLRYLREEPRRRPTPGSIYAIAKAEMPRPVRVYPRPAGPERVRVKPEVAQSIVEDFGFARPVQVGDAAKLNS